MGIAAWILDSGFNGAVCVLGLCHVKREAVDRLAGILEAYCPGVDICLLCVESDTEVIPGLTVS